jgi:ribosomal protein S18 acetylase RimI-like enzyme
MGLSAVHRLIQVKIQRIREYYKKYGIWKLVLYLFSRIGIIPKREYIFFEIELQDIIPYKKNNSNFGLDFVWVKKKDFEHLNFPSEGGPLTKNEAFRRLTETNYILLALTSGNKIVCYIWCKLTTMVHIAVLDLLVSIPDKTAYAKDLYTAPEFRGKGLASKIKILQLQFLKKHGYQRVFNIIRSNNIASLKVDKKVGTKKYQIVIYRKILFLKYYCVRDYGTNKRKRFWYIKGIDQKLWKHFSKIRDN